MRNMKKELNKTAINHLLRRRRAPLAMSIELTNRCPFNCPHCYLSKENDTLLPLNKVISCIDQFVAMGGKKLTLTGGDPLLHPSFIDIYNYAFERDLDITVFISGFVLSEKILFLWKEKRPFKVEITLYSSTDEGYYNITKKKNAFSTVIHNINSLKSIGVPVKGKCFVGQFNADDVLTIVEMIKNLGISDEKAQVDYHILPRRFMDRSVQKYQVDIEKAIEIDLSVSPENREIWKQGICDTSITDPSDPLFQCGAGRYSFSVLSNNDMQLCTFAYFSAQSLDTHSVNDVWKSFEYYVNLQAKDSCICNCPLSKICKVCPVMGYLSTGSLYGKDPFLCELAQEKRRVITG